MSNSVDQLDKSKTIEKIQKCGLCTRKVIEMRRYPHYICEDCISECPPTNENNEPIEFFNIDISGGFRSKANNVYGNEHICYIKNIKCYAEEGRYGGIVFTPFEYLHQNIKNRYLN